MTNSSHSKSDKNCFLPTAVLSTQCCLISSLNLPAWAKNRIFFRLLSKATGINYTSQPCEDVWEPSLSPFPLVMLAGWLSHWKSICYIAFWDQFWAICTSHSVCSNQFSILLLFAIPKTLPVKAQTLQKCCLHELHTHTFPNHLCRHSRTNQDSKRAWRSQSNETIWSTTSRLLLENIPQEAFLLSYSFKIMPSSQTVGCFKGQRESAEG